MSIFISYAPKASDIANELAFKLQNLNYKISIDRTKEKAVWSVDDFKRISKEVLASSLFICFVDKEYAAAKNSKTELSFACSQKSKVLPIMLEKDIAPGVDSLLIKFNKFHAYKNPDIYESWPQELFNELVEAIKLNIG
jgi:hypothetical protein